MADEFAFDDAEFLGLARRSRRDPYRLGLFARHFEIGERASFVLPVAGGTLVGTDRRLLLFTPHLEVDGAWNVREFTGYVVSREIPLDRILEVRPFGSVAPNEIVEGISVFTPEGPVDFVVSKGLERVVSDEDIGRILARLTQRSPSGG